MREVYDAVLDEDVERARGVDGDLREIYAMCGVTTNPIPVKTALGMLGLVSARMRLPLVNADDSQQSTIRTALERRGLLATSAG